MLNLIRAEQFKLRRSTAFKVCLLATTLCAALLFGMSHAVAAGKFTLDPNAASGLSDIFLLSVIGPLMAGIIICNDFDSKNIHTAVACGRVQIVCSKSIIFVLSVAVMVLPYAIFALIGFASNGGFAKILLFSTYDSIMANDMNQVVNATTIGKSTIVLLLSIVLYAARLSFCIPIAFKVRKSVVVAIIGVVFGFLIDFIVSTLSKIEVLKTLLGFTPFRYTSLSIDMSTGELMKVFLSSVVFTILMIGVTYKIFRRSEIK